MATIFSSLSLTIRPIRAEESSSSEETSDLFFSKISEDFPINTPITSELNESISLAINRTNNSFKEAQFQISPDMELDMAGTKKLINEMYPSLDDPGAVLRQKQDQIMVDFDLGKNLLNKVPFIIVPKKEGEMKFDAFSNVNNHIYKSASLSIRIKENQLEDIENKDTVSSTTEETTKISPRSGTIAADLDISPVNENVLSGDDALYKLVFKVTGASTRYKNGVISVQIPTDYQLSSELSDLRIMDIVPTLEPGNTLIYKIGDVEPGKTYETIIKVKTENGTTINGTKVTINSEFTADQFEGKAKDDATVNIISSTTLSSSKSYMKTQDKSGSTIDTIPTATNIGIWQVKVSAQNKLSGLAFLKPGQKIKIIDTIPSGLTYIDDDSGGVYDSKTRTITWEIDTPTLAMQKNAVDSLFDQTINIRLQFDSDISNFASFTNTIHSETINISDQTISSDAENTVTTGISDPSGVDESPGYVWSPNHSGPINGRGQTGIGNADPLVYDSADLSFGVYVVPFVAANLTKDFTKYELTYNVDPNLNVETINVPNFKYSPLSTIDNGRFPEDKQPKLDVYLTINGLEKKYITNAKPGKHYDKKDLGLTDGTHVQKIRINFTYAPAGMLAENGGFFFHFSIKKGFVGTVKNTVEYDVSGYKLNGEVSQWNNYSDMNEVTKYTGYRTAEVVATPPDTIPIARTTIGLDKAPGGIVQQGENRITGKFGAVSSSITALNKPFEGAILLPKDIKVNESNPEYQLKNIYEWDSKTIDGNNENGTIRIVSNNFNNTGRQLVRIAWDDSINPPGKVMSYAFNVIIGSSVSNPIQLDTYGYSGNPKIGVPSGAGTLTDSYIEKDTNDLNQNGKTDDLRVKSSNKYTLLKNNMLETKKQVKGSLDSSFSDFGHTTSGGEITYNVELTKRNAEDTINKFTLIDVLPSINDLGITDGVSRGSQFEPVLTGPLVLSWQPDVDILYSESRNPSREDLTKNVVYPETTTQLVDPKDAENPNWKTEEQITDWTKIHSYMIRLKDGVEWNGLSNLVYSFKMQAPQKDQITDPNLLDPTVNDYDRAAWNSFAYQENTSQVIEPLKVGVVMTDTYKLELKKVDQDNQKTGLAGAEYQLMDSEGKEVARKLTNESGEIDFGTILPGKYTLKETKAPTGYQLATKVYELTIDGLGNLYVMNKDGSVISQGKADASGIIQLVLGDRRKNMLPETGSKLLISFISIGGLLILTSLGYVGYKKRDEQGV